MAGERVIVPGVANKALVLSRRVLPEAARAKTNEKLYAPTDAEDRKRERGDFAERAEAKAEAEEAKQHV